MKKKQLKLKLKKLKKIIKQKDETLEFCTGAITTLRENLNLARGQLNAEKAQTARTEQHIISCENSNGELHDKLDAYRVVLKDMVRE